MAMHRARGTISFSSSSFLVASEPSAAASTPVTLPPGRPRLVTKPSATGSKLPTITIGMVRVAAMAARVAPEPPAMMASQRSATSSRASTGIRSMRPSA
jgi:hypothetical protein